MSYFNMFMSYCRVCLKNKGVKPIFGDGHNPDLSKKVREFGCIPVAKDDNWPMYICCQCFELLQGAITFRKQAKRTNKFLKFKSKSLCLAVKNTDENKVTSQPIDIHCEKKTKDLNYRVTSHHKVRGSSLPSVTASAGIDFEDHHSSDQAVVKTEQILDDNLVGLHFMYSNNRDNVGNDTNENSVTTWISSNGPTPEVSNFYCTYCNLTFNIKSELEEHKNTIAHKTNYVTSFFPVDDDDNRTPNEIDDSDRKCDICDKNFTKSEYLSHMLGEHKDAINQKTNYVMSFFPLDIDDVNRTTNENSSTEQRMAIDNCDRCDICDAIVTKSDYLNHMLREHKDAINEKTNYVMSFFRSDSDADKSSKNLKLNTRITQQRKFIKESEKTCEICEKNFSRQEYLNHMLLEHNLLIQLSPNIDKLPCLVCKELITGGRPYKAHLKKMHGQRKDLPKLTLKIECPTCKILFYSTGYYEHCLVAHNNQRENYICDQCGKDFYHLSKLNKHILKHSNNFPYKCDHCPYKVYDKSLLAIHVRTHTGDYRYKCPHCDCRYITKSNLNAHIKRRHRGPIDFICDCCSKGFYSKLELERHVTIRHKGVKTHVCSICGAAYGYRKELRRHERRTHKRAKMIGKPKAVYLRRLEENDQL